MARESTLTAGKIAPVQETPDLVLIGGPPYFSPTSSSCRLLARAWRYRGGRVLYVEIGGDQGPFREQARRQGALVKAEDGISVARVDSVRFLPFSYPERLRRYHLRTRWPILQDAISNAGFKPDKFIALFYGWFWDEWVERIRARFRVYDCIDEHRACVHVAKSPRLVAHVWAAEKRMLQHVDLLVVTSEVLLKDRMDGPKSHLYLPHAVDVAHYASAAPGDEEPQPLVGLPNPRFVLMGNLQPKLDFSVLERLAAFRSEWLLVTLGPSERRTRLPAARENLVHLGRQAYEDLPRFLAHMDVGLIPLKSIDYNLASSPLKLLEYLAAGLPVVTHENPIINPWAKACPEFVRQVEPGGDWMAACEAALEAGRRLGRETIRKSVAHCTYEARIEKLLAALGV